jgi:hypothetical protein
MDLTRRPTVIETSLRTSAVALRDPDPLPERRHDQGGRLTLTRIYIPLNAAGLRSLSIDGALGGAPFVAHAVTESVRAADPGAGMDEWEFAALNDAAQTSGSMLTPGEGLRVVAAADVSSDLVDTSENADSDVGSAVSISDSVALRRIASFHVDGDASQDDALLWYDVTELPVVLALL